MNRPTEDRTGFFGTYFDRDAALRIARWAGILAWAVLAGYLYTTLVSLGQFFSLVISGVLPLQDMGLFDRLSIPSQYLPQIIPGLVYFVMLKLAQQVLLILLDVEDNSRRAARN